MRSHSWPIGFVVAVALAGCGGEAPPEGADQEAAPAGQQQAAPAVEPASGQPAVAAQPADRMEGRVALSGTDEVPMVRLRPEEGQAVTLTGDLLPELSRLSGATVAVEGTKRGSGMMAQFEVASYEIVGIDGERPVVGVLQQQGTSFRIAAEGGAVALSNVPDALARNVGGEVWVIGVRESGTLQVQSFGVIRYP